MEMSSSIQNLAKALASAQGEMGGAAMNATNPFLKNKYADLGEVIKASKAALKSHGLAVAQLVGGDGESISVETILMHESGEWIKEIVSLPTGEERGKSQAQVAGSIVTYLRRYSLAAILGMYADEDSDGNEERQTRQPTRQQQKPQYRDPEPEPTTPQTMTLETALNVTNSKGEKYGDLTTDELSRMTIGINTALKKPELSDAERETYQLKLDAIKTIIASRNGAKVNA